MSRTILCPGLFCVQDYFVSRTILCPGLFCVQDYLQAAASAADLSSIRRIDKWMVGGYEILRSGALEAAALAGWELLARWCYEPGCALYI